MPQPARGLGWPGAGPLALSGGRGETSRRDAGNQPVVKRRANHRNPRPPAAGRGERGGGVSARVRKMDTLLHFPPTKHLIRAVTAVLLLTICGHAPITQAADARSTLEQLSKEYRRAARNQQKRNVALLAIDAGIIGEETPIAVAVRLFGKDFQNPVHLEPNGSGYGIVYFGTFILPSKDKDGQISQGAISGWHLVLRYGVDQRIKRYELINSSK